jgi:hypothetical protein
MWPVEGGSVEILLICWFWRLVYLKIGFARPWFGSPKNEGNKDNLSYFILFY